MTIGERIKSRRIELGLSQTDLALKAGYKDKTAISKIESGVNELNQSKIVKFSEILDVSISWLMGWKETELETASNVAAELFLATKNGDRINKLINKYNDLTEEEKDQVDAFIDFVKLQRKV